MLKPRQVLIGIILLLGISFSPLVNSNVLVGESSIESSSELNSINGLSNSESHWNLISGESQTGHSIRELSGLLNLAHGSFDPLADEFPTIPLSYVNYNDYDVTGMKYIQFHDYDYQLITELEEAGHLTVLDILGEGNFIVRILPTHTNTLDILTNSELIRYVGNVQPGYRLHPSLLYDNVYTTVSIIPASDLGYGGYEELALDLVRFGANDAWCGFTMCQVEMRDSEEFLFNAARDGRILWIEPTSSMEVHNGVARAISGVVSLDADASFTLDGS